MTQARFYHAGCPVCISAEQTLLNLLDPKVQVEIVHLGDQSQRVSEAEQAGVKSVPALVVDGQVLHLNFGASIDDLK
ncbi:MULTISPECIES: glutaredoxin domain-containing protein [unclassified Pseudomonas]|uniref:glutaredoxin domain-containing protein n=1 Tax=unclassified Pseudomonas TaxID=196821 RepID=UPI00244A45B3|nr:glutaredoxin domain-containing protein [Pseudomonas sp. GD03944]MDH1265645.1 thioredoxin family protein [Pseudomonas sp. GD03944]HWV10580.1 glutaredoxin domain-containing protein [Pseudomonas sp.]